MVVFHALRKHGSWTWFGDASLFYRMADEWPFRPGGWWQYRILVPFLVHVLPLGTEQGFALIAALSLGGAGAAIVSLLRHLGFGPVARALGALLYLSSFAVLYNSYNYALPDPFALLLLALACRAIVRGRDLELAVWLLLGALAKEVVLYVVPARWLYRRRAGLDLPQALRTALVTLPALAAFLWLRLQPGEAEELAGFVGGNAWLFPWKHQPDNLARLYSPLGAGWALLVLAYRRPGRFAVATIGFAVPCVASLLVTDAGRMLAYLTPFAIPLMLGAAGMRERVTRRGLAAVLLAALSMRLWEPFAPLARIPLPVRRGLALLLAPVCFFLALGRRAAEEGVDRDPPGPGQQEA
jgi:hypothetical protein